MNASWQVGNDAMKTMCTDKAVNDNMVATEDAIRTSRIWHLIGKRSNATHSPGRGIPGGDLWAFDTMSRRAYPAPAGTKADK